MSSNGEIITRNVLRLAGGLSVSYVVSNLISNNVNTSTLPRKAATTVGIMLIGSAVAKKTEPILDEQIDAVVTFYKSLRSKP